MSAFSPAHSIVVNVWQTPSQNIHLFFFFRIFRFDVINVWIQSEPGHNIFFCSPDQKMNTSFLIIEGNFCPVSHRENLSTDRFVLYGDVTPLSASISPAWKLPDWRQGLILWTSVYVSGVFIFTIWQSLQPVYFLIYKLLNTCRKHHRKKQDVLVHFTTHTQFNFFCQQEGDGCYGNVTMGMPCLSIVSVPCHTCTQAQTLTQREPRTARLNMKP